jgi:hypothetical protein
MEKHEFFVALMKAENIKQLETALAKYRADHGTLLNEVPFGRRPNNRGTIEVASDAGRAAIERITNAHDALLELEHHRHSGKPECRSPREAASAWLGVSDKDGLAGLSIKQRQDLAAKTIIRLQAGEGGQSRILTIEDRGIGIPVSKMEQTILSLNESNKITKHYLAGTYGQGGSSTLAFSAYVVVASRYVESDEIAFTVVRYLNLPAEEYKTGHYVYLVEDDRPLVVKAKWDDMEYGTTVRHFGYDLTDYPFAIGPRSLYGALQRVLFDPVAPVRFENMFHGWNRTIKGSRNALNGAVDVGDDGRGPDIDYHLPMFNVSLGDYGSIGIEYWVLKKPAEEKGKGRKNPVDAFVDSRRPIIISHNGQNQGELSVQIIKQDAELPFLRNRLICHVTSDYLAAASKRLLFSSTREQSREGFILSRIREELISLLRSDDELRRLNDEARDQSLREHDETAKQQMRRQVAKLLRIAGAGVVEVGGGKAKTGGDGTVVSKHPRGKPEPITPKEPPTFIRIVWDDEKDISFYGGQRRYIRIETDANSTYHDPHNPSASKINIAVGEELSVFGTSPLTGGRMRIGIECNPTVALGTKGTIRVELYRLGMTALSDERGYVITEQPKPKEEGHAASFPDFEVIPVEGPEEANWDYVCDNSGDTDVCLHASGAVMNEGTLYVYYSTAFPRFATELKRIEIQNIALAPSFKKRYELWLAVHALLMVQEAEKEIEAESSEGAELTIAEMKRQERCRLASIAVMVSSQEVKSGLMTEEAGAV